MRTEQVAASPPTRLGCRARLATRISPGSSPMNGQPRGSRSPGPPSVSTSAGARCSSSASRTRSAKRWRCPRRSPSQRRSTPCRPTPPTISGPSGVTNDPTPTFSFSSRNRGPSFECKIDNGPLYAPAVRPRTIPHLPDGPHTLSVRAKDAAPQHPLQPDRPATSRSEPPRSGSRVRPWWSPRRRGTRTTSRSPALRLDPAGDRRPQRHLQGLRRPTGGGCTQATTRRTATPRGSP